MILLVIAAAAAAQWTGPRTEEYRGPGDFCGGGYSIRLARGDRALVLPQSQSAGVQGVRIVLAGREINVWSGAHGSPGPVVRRFGRTEVRQQDDAGGVSYTVSDQTDFALRLTSGAFHGYRRDSWFFARANFSAAAEDRARCLAAQSY